MILRAPGGPDKRPATRSAARTPRQSSAARKGSSATGPTPPLPIFVRAARAPLPRCSRAGHDFTLGTIVAKVARRIGVSTMRPPDCPGGAETGVNSVCPRGLSTPYFSIGGHCHALRPSRRMDERLDALVHPPAAVSPLRSTLCTGPAGRDASDARRCPFLCAPPAHPSPVAAAPAAISPLAQSLP
jgi:hypothetical protein